ncbi:MAG: 8-oxo-dGTP diphosphatase [Chlamydiales bacterium]|nr:8-oxo-dGTP diphosphatase [Chlamydiales bacterium]
MPYTPIIGTLGFVLSPDRTKVLLVHRIGRDDDYHQGKFNGLGGKLESHEDILSGMRREIHEEAGIICEEMQLRGTINWTGFGPKGEDWLGFIFLITKFSGDVYSRNVEGPLEWIDVANLSKLPMWEGDRYFLPLVFDDDSRLFYGHMPYDGDKPVSWSFVRL